MALFSVGCYTNEECRAFDQLTWIALAVDSGLDEINVEGEDELDLFLAARCRGSLVALAFVRARDPAVIPLLAAILRPFFST